MIFVAPSIVTNGLVLCYDAANQKSYPGSGTVLTDLCKSGSNGTLINSVGFSSSNSGQFTFNGTNQRIDTTYNVSLNDFTVGVWFKVPDSSNGSTTRLVDKQYGTAFWLGKTNSAAGHLWGGGILKVASPYGIYIPLTDGEWHYLVSVRSGTTHTIYGDGITNTASVTIPSTPISTSATLRIGSDDTDASSVRLKGNIAMVQLYNRALTPTEILQNFNATKGRFGL